jgi:pyruvate dehydrogenase E2 component (dihydrolipoamide acetyltransferase)
MEFGTITAWRIAPGDPFHVGDTLFEVETDKNVVDVTANVGGVLHAIYVDKDEDEVPVGTVLAVALEPGEQVTATEIDEAVAAARQVIVVVDAFDDPGEPVGDAAPTVHEADKRPLRAMPKARALAAANSIPLESITGSGDDGAITVTDVESAIASLSAPAATVMPVNSDSDIRVRERRLVRGVAKAMADNVARSWAEVPQFSQQFFVDATRLVKAHKDAPGKPPTYTELLILAMVRAVADVPEVNATFAGDEIITFEDVNISVATATDRGLLVPVLRRAQLLNSSTVAGALRPLIARARNGTLTPGEDQGGTITLSNLGGTGVEIGIPLVPSPQAAIVFVAELHERPAVVDSQVAVRPMFGVGVSYDHRVIDGVIAARFATAFRSAIEDAP